jgi:hypothetical protein
MKAQYRYPQAAFPYRRLVEENARRGLHDREFELSHTGVMDEGRVFDVVVEYAKRAPNDILIRITATNGGPEPAPLHLLPQLWFRNTWAWGRVGEAEAHWPRPALWREAPHHIATEHESLGRFDFAVEPHAESQPMWLFTDNETNAAHLYGASPTASYTKDAFHRRVVGGDTSAVREEAGGTKAAPWYAWTIPPGEARTVRLRLFHEDEAPEKPFGRGFADTLRRREAEHEAHQERVLPAPPNAEHARIARQALAGLLWSKQFYHYVVQQWLEGDPGQPPPPPGRGGGNRDWMHLYNFDILCVPDKWEYPWYAVWDLAFHMVPMARLDPEFAKSQLLLFLREWYMHPSGALPAYELNLSDVNPPVHAWACWRVYKITGPRGKRDRDFLERAFQKLLLNFTWWVNRKDEDGNHVFGGGFLGLDNIGVFNRSEPLPSGMTLEQADGTAWMAFYCGTMLSMALELAEAGNGYEDLASKFFEHYVHIADAINSLGGEGLWDERDGFYYDMLHTHQGAQRMRVRSLVGLIPLLAVEVISQRDMDRLPGFRKRTNWFLENRPDLAKQISYMEGGDDAHFLLALPSRERLERMLGYLLDEEEFLAPYGIRSLSRYHAHQPFEASLGGQRCRVA